MKKLPRIYKDSISKKIINNQEYDYCSKDNRSVVINKNPVSINDQINEIFDDVGYSFNTPVVIETPSKIYETSLIGRRGNHIITMEGDLIEISSIKNFQNKKS